jgi:hypothetical protein
MDQNNKNNKQNKQNKPDNSIKSVYASDFVNIVEGPSRGIFKIIFAYPSRALINSLIKTKIIQGGTATDDYKTLQFKANTVTTLINIPTNKTQFAAQMTSSLATQLNYLITAECRTIIGYAPENIIVINGKKSAFIGSEWVAEIEGTMFQLSYPFSPTDFFVSPELLQVKELPSHVHYKTAYFSLACLITHVLLSPEHEYYNEYLKNKDPQTILSYLKNNCINGTKLYWLLSRCLVEDPKRRSILYI